jgi:hypothetical protein
MRLLGRPTRGTTNPNRLRRVDNWIVSRFAARLRSAPVPLVVDLGYGHRPTTTVELYARLARACPDVRVVGLEIDAARVAAATPLADPPALVFAHGGFELAGLRPLLVRAMNVLREYDESEVDSAWTALRTGLAPGGFAVEGTCDELGRLAAWVCLDAAGPVSLTLAARLSTLDRPATLAERLPKALIHHNVPGTRIHAAVAALDAAWVAAAPYAPFGPRQRWIRAVAALRDTGWPVLDRVDRWRLGEVTLSWTAVGPGCGTPAGATGGS